MAISTCPVNTKSIRVRYQDISCIKKLFVDILFLRHAIFNEQNDLDHGDRISHDVVRLVMLFEYQTDKHVET